MTPSSHVPQDGSPKIAAAMHVDAVGEWRTRIAGICMGVVFAGVGVPLAELIGIRGPAVILVILATGAVAGVGTWKWSSWFVESSARAFLSFIQPSGKSVPYQKSYSYEQSLIARGRIQEALEAYEAAMVANPHDATLRCEMAEACAAHGQPQRAVQLLAELREMPSASARQRMYATQRLIDLMVGPLGDRGRAMRELRRLIDEFPETMEAAGARQALARLKTEHLGPSA